VAALTAELAPLRNLSAALFRLENSRNEALWAPGRRLDNLMYARVLRLKQESPVRTFLPAMF
jgi:hypothetical protein